MVREVVLAMNETRIKSMPFIFLNHMPTWDMDKFYHWQVEHPHRSRLELRIPCFATMVYVGYFLASSCEIPIRIREVV